MDFEADDSEVPSFPPGLPGKDPEWNRYPQSLFGNWTPEQVDRCGILKPTHNETCKIHTVDVFIDGTFDRANEDRPYKVESPWAYRNRLQTPVSNAYVSYPEAS